MQSWTILPRPLPRFPLICSDSVCVCRVPSNFPEFDIPKAKAIRLWPDEKLISKKKNERNKKAGIFDLMRKKKKKRQIIKEKGNSRAAGLATYYALMTAAATTTTTTQLCMCI